VADGAVEQGCPTDLLPLCPFSEDDVGVFLGLGFSVVVLSVVFVILMCKKSARKRYYFLLHIFIPDFQLVPFFHNILKINCRNQSFSRQPGLTVGSFTH